MGPKKDHNLIKLISPWRAPKNLLLRVLPPGEDASIGEQPKGITGPSLTDNFVMA